MGNEVVENVYPHDENPEDHIGEPVEPTDPDKEEDDGMGSNSSRD